MSEAVELAGTSKRREQGTSRSDPSSTSPEQEVPVPQEQERSALDVVDMDCYESEGGASVKNTDICVCKYILTH